MSLTLKIAIIMLVVVSDVIAGVFLWRQMVRQDQTSKAIGVLTALGVSTLIAVVVILLFV